MASAHEEIAREMFAAVHDRDYETAAAGFHPDAIWINTHAFPGPPSCTGPEEIVAFWRALYESFEDGGGLEVLEAAG